MQGVYVYLTGDLYDLVIWTESGMCLQRDDARQSSYQVHHTLAQPAAGVIVCIANPILQSTKSTLTVMEPWKRGPGVYPHS